MRVVGEKRHDRFDVARRFTEPVQDVLLGLLYGIVLVLLQNNQRVVVRFRFFVVRVDELVDGLVQTKGVVMKNGRFILVVELEYRPVRRTFLLDGIPSAGMNLNGALRTFDPVDVRVGVLNAFVEFVQLSAIDVQTDGDAIEHVLRDGVHVVERVGHLLDELSTAKVTGDDRNGVGMRRSHLKRTRERLIGSIAVEPFFISLSLFIDE